MPITVVTHRDDVGAPTNREVYAAGGTWRRGASGLEILSADRRVIALYPDGNWLSVYADNRVRVHTEGRPEEEPVPRLAGAPESAQPGAEPRAAAGTPETSTSDDAVYVPDEIIPAQRAAAGPGDDSDAAVTDTVDIDPIEDASSDTEVIEAEAASARADAVDAETLDAETADGDAEASVPVADGRDTDEPVAAADNAADPDPPTATRPSSLPPGMRPVAFRPRVIRPARRPEEPTRPSPMRPLVFRVKTIRKPDE